MKRRILLALITAAFVASLPIFLVLLAVSVVAFAAGWLNTMLAWVVVRGLIWINAAIRWAIRQADRARSEPPPSTPLPETDPEPSVLDESGDLEAPIQEPAIRFIPSDDDVELAEACETVNRPIAKAFDGLGSVADRQPHRLH